MEHYETNQRSNEEVLAFLEDLSGQRKFVRVEGEIYFVDQEGNKTKSSPEAVESAVEKYRYQLPVVKEGGN